MSWQDYASGTAQTNTYGAIPSLDFQSNTLGALNNATAQTSANTGTYVPVAGDFTYANGYTASGSTPSYKLGGTGQNIYNKNDFGSASSQDGFGSAAGGSSGFFGDMSGAEKTNFGINALATVGGLYSMFEQNKLAKDSFKFNKEMATKNYNMTKDAYDRRIRRGSNISDQLAGKSYDDVYAAQQEYSAARDAKNARLESEGKM